MAIFIKPEMTSERVDEIRGIIAENPEMGRTALSRHICALWEWQSPTGILKDIAARDMLRSLDKSGLISLPPSKNQPSKNQSKARFETKWLHHEKEPVKCSLKELLPLQIETITGGSRLIEFKSYIDQFHYLHYGRQIGENMKYMVWSRNGTPLACMLFGSAAWSCADRDKYIGWNKEQRAKNLMFLTANSRFLIFPWIEVLHLASKILSSIAKRISNDWLHKYGHPLFALETYVDGRFKGTCYKAAGWVRVGMTTGRGRDGGHHNSILPKKDIYLLPLCKDFQDRLGGSEC